MQAPGMGDDVQAIKAGILEIADVFVINKADQPGADRVERELRAALSLAEGPHPPFLMTVATEGKGVTELLDVLAARPLKAQGVSAAAPPGTPVLRMDNLENAIAFYAAPGLRPTCLPVADLAAAAAEVSAAGGRLLNQPPANSAAHLYVFLEPSSPRAVLLEITQESAS